MRGGHRPTSGSAARDAAFRQVVEDAKLRFNLSDIVQRTRKLHRGSKGERRALCAFHDEKSPSMQINDAKGTYYCFGCGATGDLIQYVMQVEKCDFKGALRWLGAAELPAVDPAQRAKAAEEDEALRRAAIADAQLIWDRSIVPNGTLAERYLREVRGITMPLPPSVRFGVVPTGRDEHGRWKQPYPAVIFAARDRAGAIVGVQRVFLSDDGMSKRWGKKSKLSLGRPRGSVVLLSDGAPDEWVVTEGPEDGLSLAQEMPGRSVGVALGTAMMVAVDYPPLVRSVVIAGQNDAAGHAAVCKAVAGLVERGLSVKTMFPDRRFKDFNDQLCGKPMVERAADFIPESTNALATGE